MSSYKTGRWSEEEVKLVKQLTEEGLSYEAMESRLNRPANTIQKMVEQKLMMNLTEDAQLVRQAENDIKNSAEWRELSRQLSEDEQEMFLHHWRELIAQFKNDVTHTERLQIMDVIRNEILLGRVLYRINISNQDIQDYRDEYMKERKLAIELQDPNKLVDLQRKIADCQIAIGAFNREYKDLSERKNATLKDIKGTREQRIKRIEESKETITGWITALMAAPELREKLGKWTEKFRLAQEVEYHRLSEYHTYDDGQLEQPILNADNIKEDNL
jgi:hypothetical protein